MERQQKLIATHIKELQECCLGAKKSLITVTNFRSRFVIWLSWENFTF